MKRIFLFVCFLALIIACQTEKSGETETLEQGAREGASSSAQSHLPILTDDQLVAIYEAQELIKIDQNKRELRERYCRQAYFPEKGVFISMGIAALHHPETGAPVARGMAERAARIDAIRWASYGEIWLKNNFDPPFGQIDTRYGRKTEIIDQTPVGDSLFVFIASFLPDIKSTN